jgi:hypothetical protein
VAVPRGSFARLLTALAWLNVALHVAGLALAAIGMRPGTPAAPLEERVAYLSGGPLGWTLGWAAWMACALALVAFLSALVYRLEAHPLGEKVWLARLGLTIAVVGAAFDLLCDSIYILVLPMLAGRRPFAEDLFLTVERVTGIASMFVANGAYSTGILLIVLELRRRASRLTTTIGCAVAGFGFLLAAAGLTGVAWHAEYATGPTIGLFCVWVVLTARALEPRTTSP